jgi:3-deoxy-D-manno-octulosonate 8-phosphate phosphatase (KDO 8-P phosphatase)
VTTGRIWRLITRCAFSAAPPHAHAEVLARVDFVTRLGGGQGAVREFCDLLLMAAGRYDPLLQEVLA